MKRWTGFIPFIVAGALVAGVLIRSQAAHGATTRTLSYDVATLVQVPGSTHRGAPPCPEIPTENPGSEFKGSLIERSGSLLFPVQLSPGSTVKQLKYTVVDSDSDPGVDSFAYLLRKRLAPGLTKDAGYSVMALAHSTGGATTTRQFTDNTIVNAVVDPGLFAYYLEVVNCSLTVEPIGVQITLSGP